MMAGIRGKNTKPEVLLRKGLHAKGLRFRLHAASLPGRPDIVFPRYNAVCFVHGCFWHQHSGCRYAATPKTRPEFWQLKFAANNDRDKVVVDLLQLGGWRIAIVWECTLRTNGPAHVAGTLKGWLQGGSPYVEL
jgi:DNA mismatch endonuclease (patch repair protein)